MLGGINQGAYSNLVPDGHLLPRYPIMAKKHGSASEYFAMFHNTIDNYPSFWQFWISVVFYLSVIADGNNEAGSLLQKFSYNLELQSILENLHSCRHANGRDWWVICRRPTQICVLDWWLPHKVSGFY
ncbi:MAG: hypothetical protein IPP34_22065 [Bacteroidetes bacterium]|nr:hypothetical protein [Bacteroidota bacterium]